MNWQPIGRITAFLILIVMITYGYYDDYRKNYLQSPIPCEQLSEKDCPTEPACGIELQKIGNNLNNLGCRTKKDYQSEKLLSYWQYWHKHSGELMTRLWTR